MCFKEMMENISQLLKEYKNTKECLESGLKWLPQNEYAISKIEVINMIIRDLEQLEEKLS
jgi:transcriptional/translational regulatory protein YebC/TACO1